MPASQMAQPGQGSLAPVSPPMFSIAQHVLLIFYQNLSLSCDSLYHILYYVSHTINHELLLPSGTKSVVSDGIRTLSCPFTLPIAIESVFQTLI